MPFFFTLFLLKSQCVAMTGKPTRVCSVCLPCCLLIVIACRPVLAPCTGVWQNFYVEDVFAVFASEADDRNLIDRAAFNRCFNLFLVDEHDHEDAERHRLVLSHLFDLFDADHDGYVDFTELLSGLSVYCGGSREEQYRAAFSLYGTHVEPCCSTGTWCVAVSGRVVDWTNAGSGCGMCSCQTSTATATSRETRCSRT